jgi:prophage antirepressor-like protein
MSNLIKIESWNGHEIRFVFHHGEWWAVLADIAKPLGLKTFKVSQRLRIIESSIKKDILSKYTLPTKGGTQEMLIVNEYGIYEAITQSRKKEAIEFRFWVYDILKELRQATGLEGFQIFRMLDKEHQKEMMKKLKEGLKQPTKVDYIKANSIANKAISNLFGYPKMIKKGEMAPEMLVKREAVLEDTVELMALKEKYGLDISVSQAIYNKYKGTA